jgi:putative DNA primase/helicase
MMALSDGDAAARRIEIARRIWGEAREARGTPVERYLAGRGITLAPSGSLRYASALRHPDGSAGPAMVARIDGPDGAIIGIHRTWLDQGPDGVWRRRLPKMMLGRAAGGAVRLAPAAETLVIAEGIETTLAIMVATGLPGWAALSAIGIERLILPAIVRHVVIAADHDAGGTGERAARAAAARWLAEGRRVRIALRPSPGDDIADVLIGRSSPEARCDPA